MAKIEIYYPDYSLFLKEIIMEKKQTSFKLSGESPTGDILPTLFFLGRKN